MSSQEKGSESRMTSLIGILKRLISFDPVFALLAIFVIFPLAPSVVEATLQMNDQVITRFIVILGAFMAIVYIPLLLVKATINRDDTLAKQRTQAIEDERERRKLRERINQKRINEIVEAKLNNINLKSQVLLENSKHFEKFLIAEAAKEMREAIDQRLTDDEKISNLDLNNKYVLIVEAFEALGKKIDFIEKSLPELQKAMDSLNKEPDDKDLPNIKVNSQIQERDDNLATAHLFIKEKEDEIENLQRKNALFEEEKRKFEEKIPKQPTPWKFSDDMKVTFNEKSSEDFPHPAPGLEIHTEPPPERDGLTISLKDKSENNQAIEEALKIVDDLEDTENEETVVDSNYWTCGNCERVNPKKTIRCRVCRKSKGFKKSSE